MNKKMKLIIFIICCLIGLLVFSALAGKEKSDLIFSHKLHVIENELDCNTCHEAALNSVLGKDNLMPSKESCGDCHDIESPDDCGICHSEPENAKIIPRVGTVYPFYSHKKHLNVGLECKDCHQGIEKKDVVEPYLLPIIESCQTCHTEKKVKPQSHSSEYMHSHGDDAKSKTIKIDASQTCSACHAPVFCQYCHEGDNLDRVTHPLNYAFIHSMDAAGKERECSACHIERSFCAECHRQYFIIPHNHVAGWATPYVGGTHVDEARIDLENCLACHESNAEQTCQKSGCHSK
jgi:hypothetical protein